MRGAVAAALALGLTACASISPADRTYLRLFAAAERAGQPFAPVTEAQPDLAFPAAYRLQSQIVARRVRAGDRVAGYKGGLMSAASLKGRNVTEPLVGVLFASGRAEAGASVSLCGYRRAASELKLGYVFGKAVAPGADMATLRAAVTAVVPVIDLPDISYRDPDHYGAVDMVAANISAARWVAGARHATDATDLDALRVVMTHDGQQVAAGTGGESLGNQWQSLRTVLRLIAASGRKVRPGDIVITGKIGDRIWLPPGAYSANYGPLGTVPFSVKPCPS